MRGVVLQCFDHQIECRQVLIGVEKRGQRTIGRQLRCSFRMLELFDRSFLHVVDQGEHIFREMLGVFMSDLNAICTFQTEYRAEHPIQQAMFPEWLNQSDWSKTQLNWLEESIDWLFCKRRDALDLVWGILPCSQAKCKLINRLGKRFRIVIRFVRWMQIYTHRSIKSERTPGTRTL